MRNQIEMAERVGVRAATINSANRDEWDEIEDTVAPGEVDLLLISPERLNNPRFRHDVLPASRARGRPARRRRGPLHQRLGPRLPPRLPPHRPRPRPPADRRARAVHAPRPPTTASSTTSSTSSATTSSVLRGPLDRESLALVGRRPARTRPTAWRGCADVIPDAAGLRHRLLPHHRATPSGSPAGCAPAASTPLAYTRRERRRATASTSRRRCSPTR